jgi:hypothetical protein
VRKDLAALVRKDLAALVRKDLAAFFHEFKSKSVGVVLVIIAVSALALSVKAFCIDEWEVFGSSGSHHQPALSKSTEILNINESSAVPDQLSSLSELQSYQISQILQSGSNQPAPLSELQSYQISQILQSGSNQPALSKSTEILNTNESSAVPDQLSSLSELQSYQISQILQPGSIQQVALPEVQQILTEADGSVKQVTNFRALLSKVIVYEVA